MGNEFPIDNGSLIHWNAVFFFTEIKTLFFSKPDECTKTQRIWFYGGDWILSALRLIARHSQRNQNLTRKKSVIKNKPFNIAGIFLLSFFFKKEFWMSFVKSFLDCAFYLHFWLFSAHKLHFFSVFTSKKVSTAIIIKQYFFFAATANSVRLVFCHLNICIIILMTFDGYVSFIFKYFICHFFTVTKKKLSTKYKEKTKCVPKLSISERVLCHLVCVKMKAALFRKI